MEFFNSFLNLDFPSMLQEHRGAGILFLVLAVFVGLIAAFKGRSFLKAIALSLVTTPLLALPVALRLKSGVDARNHHRAVSPVWQFLGYLFTFLVLMLPLSTAGMLENTFPQLAGLQLLGWFMPVVVLILVYGSADGLRASKLFSIGTVAIVFGYIVLSFASTPTHWVVLAISLFFTGVPVCQLAMLRSIARQSFECKGNNNIFAMMLALTMLLSWWVVPMSWIADIQAQMAFVVAGSFGLVLLGLVVGLTLVEKAKGKPQASVDGCQGCTWSVLAAVIGLPILSVIIARWWPTSHGVEGAGGPSALALWVCVIALVICMVMLARQFISKAQQKQKTGLSLFKRVFHVVVLVFTVFVLNTGIASIVYLISLHNADVEYLPIFIVTGIVAAVVLMLIFKRYTLKLGQWNAYLTLIGLSFLISFLAIGTDGSAILFSLLSTGAFLMLLVYTAWLHSIGRQLSCGQKGRAIVLMMIIFKLLQQISWSVIHLPVHSMLANSLTVQAKINGMMMHLFHVAHANMMVMFVLAVIAYVLLFTRSCGSCETSSCGTQNMNGCGTSACSTSACSKEACGQGSCGKANCGQGSCGKSDCGQGACKTDVCDSSKDEGHCKTTQSCGMAMPASCGMQSCSTEDSVKSDVGAKAAKAERAAHADEPVKTSKPRKAKADADVSSEKAPKAAKPKAKKST